MTTKIAAFLAPIAFISAACTTVTPPPLTLNDDRIVPGERVGDVEIGMPLSMLLALKGTPLKTVPMRGSAATSYSFDGLTVAAHDQVYWIIAQDDRFGTSGGIAPGVEQIFARSVAGPPRCVINSDTETSYDYGNFYFDVDNASGKVTVVGVRVDKDVCAD